MREKDKDVINSEDFNQLGNNIAMQIAALSPLAISSERLPPDELERQRNILEEQVKALNKPVAAQAKILEGKLNKWFSEVCLLDQESVIVPKTTIRQIVEGVAKKLGTEITLVNFLRISVGEGIEKKRDNFADEAIKMAEQ